MNNSIGSYKEKFETSSKQCPEDILVSQLPTVGRLLKTIVQRHSFICFCKVV